MIYGAPFYTYQPLPVRSLAMRVSRIVASGCGMPVGGGCDTPLELRAVECVFKYRENEGREWMCDAWR
jgi:hypothetical protein